MASTSTLTPTLKRPSNLSISSPRTPIDILSPTGSLRRTRPVTLAIHAGTLAENDDATEKQQRHMSRVTALALQSPGGSTTPKSASRLTSVEGSTVSASARLTNFSQLKDLYSNCIKLSTENKINAKNAFGLHLIDHMQEFLTNLDKDQGVTNFQIASSTLDAGAKIYAGRVDSIHAQAYKMLGGLGRAENANEDGEGGADGSHDPQDESSEKVAKKKKAYKAARTIETNLNNIDDDQFDMEFEVDPLFQKTSASFDEGGTSGLVLNLLTCRDDSCETLLDSSTVTTAAMANFDWGSSQTVDLTDMKDMRERILSQSVQICPRFAEFSFTNWDRDAEGTDKEKETTFDNMTKINEHAFDVDAPATFDPVDDVPDMGGGGFDDDDGGDGGNVFNDGPGGVHGDMTANSLGFADGQEAQIVVLSGQSRPDGMTTDCTRDLGSLVLSLTSENNEYSYFKHNTLAMWAGPEHWRNRAQFSALKGLTKSVSKRKNPTKKKVFRIDFDATHDFDKLFSKGKAATVLSQTTLEKHFSNQKTLPDDLHYEFNNLMKLFLKSKLLVRRQYGVQPAVTDDDSGNNWYDYQNENDCANYCPGTQDDDGDEDVSGAGEIGPFNEYSSQEMSQALSSFNSNETVFHGDNLVAQPNKVQKIDIAYSKTAKKINVKKVKKAMWDVLVSSPRDADKENMPENAEKEPEDEVFMECVTKPCTFSELYSTIPNKISRQMANNLSVPIAFVCLLHLANEKTLKILGRESMDDFSIMQGI